MENTQPTTEQSLCLSCGLCCNGTIFMRVPLKIEDQTTLLEAAGVEIRHRVVEQSNEIKRSFGLPCAAFRQNCCQVYEDRPATCQKYRCDLLKKFERGEVLWRDAREKIVYVQKLRAALREEILKTLPEYADISIPSLFQKVPSREEMLADPVLSKKWMPLLAYLAVLRDRVETDFHSPRQNGSSEQRSPEAAAESAGS